MPPHKAKVRTHAFSFRTSFCLFRKLGSKLRSMPAEVPITEKNKYECSYAVLSLIKCVMSQATQLSTELSKTIRWGKLLLQRGSNPRPLRPKTTQLLQIKVDDVWNIQNIFYLLTLRFRTLELSRHWQPFHGFQVGLTGKPICSKFF